MMRPSIIATVIFVIGVLGVSFFYAGEQKTFSGKEYVVELRDAGFYPREITIHVGDAVTFVTKRNQEFWPASDPHPTHEYLKGFDANGPISPGKRWTYIFREAGTWSYHDHLDVSFRGEIIVVREDASEVASEKGTNGYCGGKCFDALIKEVVRKDGIDAAYKLFQETYASGKLPRACHWTAHQIGEEAYEVFRTGAHVPISHATSYCGYGFYHGFLESLLREKPDVDYALSFCSEVEKQLGKLGLWNCYHGIGHGFTEDPPDPRTWGNADAMLKPGIETCEFLFKDSFLNLNLCLTGVYTVVAGFAAGGTYGLSLDPDDPFAFCRTQPYNYHKACYGEFAPKLDKLLEGDVSRLPEYLANIHDDKTIRLVVWVVPSVTMARDILNDDHTSYVLGCRKAFTGRLKDICIGGTILGFFSHGEPEKQYLKALNFCGSDVLLDDERVLCYRELFHRVRQEYRAEKVQEVCEVAPKSYRQYCFENSYQPPYDDPSFD